MTNFATAQFCKRCNQDLSQASAIPVQNQTQVFNPANNTHFRQQPPVRQTPPVNNAGYYQNNQPPNYYQGDAGQNYQQPYQQNYRQGYQNNQNYQQPYGQPNDWSLPQFPKGQRPPRYNSYQNPYQNNNYYRTSEIAFRRIGNEVQLHKNSTLPEVCVRCGKTLTSYSGGAYVAQKLRWHHPAVYAAIVSPLIYLILAACLSERFTVDVPLCQEHMEKRDSAKTMSIIGGLLWAFLIFISFYAGAVGFGFLVFFVGLILLVLNHEYGYKPLRVKKIDGSYYHLAGASQEFLNTLPH